MKENIKTIPTIPQHKTKIEMKQINKTKIIKQKQTKENIKHKTKINK